MDAAALATMYAINVGINALGGKRGSNLYKDSFKDTAVMALTNQAMQGGNQPNQMNYMEQQAVNQAGNIGQQARIPEGLTAKDKMLFEQLPILDPSQKTFPAGAPPKEGIAGVFDKFTGIFKSEQPVIGEQGAVTQVVRDMEGNVRRVPVTMPQTDRLKLGTAAAGAAGLAYGLGAFDPVEPDKPDYPGYNKFYAQNPSQFMPYDDPEFGIDYSNYPEVPYSNIKSGGIIGLTEGGEASPLSTLQEEYEKYKKEKDSAGEEAMDFETYKMFKMQFGQAQGGIMKLMAGGRASNMPVESIEEGTQEMMDTVPPPMFQPIPMPPMPMKPMPMKPMPKFKSGALVDRLPSKTNTDENDASNYKRTSGKLVVDAAGKGNEEKDTMLAQLADGEFVTKSKAVRGAGIALGADPKDKKQQRDLGARFFYRQMADFDRLAKSMS